MRPIGVVMPSPGFDQDFRFAQIIEDFPRQQLVAKFGIETLAIAIFPWAARLDIERLHADLAQPIAQGRGYELRAIVRADMLGWTMMDEQLAQRVENVPRVEFPRHTDRQALAGEFIDHTQHAKHLAVMCAVLDEIVRPDMALVHRPQPDAGTIIQPETAAFRLFHWNLEPFTPPDAIDALLIHMPAVSPQQGRDPAVAIPAKPLCQGDDGRCQHILVVARNAWFALGRAVLADHTAGPAFGCAECLYHMIDRVSLA